MLNREHEQHKKMHDKELNIISKGTWDNNLHWDFIVTEEVPPRELCTAVCCVTTFENKLVLIKNKRGWEMPAGHIEEGETLEEAIIREAQEESCAMIQEPQFFGYKKVTAKEPVTRRDTSSSFYPNPGYVVYFYAETKSFSNEPPASDIQEVNLATFYEAQEILAPGHQYDNVLEYLVANGKIQLE